MSPEAFALKSWVIRYKYRALCQSPRHQRRLKIALVALTMPKNYQFRVSLARDSSPKKRIFLKSAFLREKRHLFTGVAWMISIKEGV